jgi:putative Holliday junction resolvase
VTDPQGRALALDLGEVRIGLAISDPLGITAQPLGVLRRVGPKRDVREIAERVREHEVAVVVLGLPLLLSGEEGQKAAEAREMAARLRGRLGDVRVVLWDERLTTVQAERAMISAGVGRGKRKQLRDSLAATLILQSYLDAQPRPAELEES